MFFGLLLKRYRSLFLKRLGLTTGLTPNHNVPGGVAFGFPPATMAPQIAITPEQVILQYPKAQEWVKGGDWYCPLLYLMKNLHNDVKKS
jgi:hypothetical protein